MEISYKNKKLEKVCTNAKTAERIYGREMAEKIHQRICEIRATDSVELLVQNRKGQYAMDLVHPKRLVFEKHGEEIEIANILEIVDYH